MRARVFAIAIVMVGACGKQQRGTPAAPELQPTSAEEATGARLFRKFCYQCHPNGAGGLGPALNNKPLPEVAIRTQIRNGVGAMPPFDEKWLSDAEVAAIAAYVQALRAAPK